MIVGSANININAGLVSIYSVRERYFILKPTPSYMPSFIRIENSGPRPVLLQSSPKHCYMVVKCL
jgi:hypothetical protein